MRQFAAIALLLLAACGEETSAGGAVALPRPALDPLPPWAPAEVARTGREVMPLENIAVELADYWRETRSCEQVAYAREIEGRSYVYRLLFAYDRSERRNFDLACEMEKHGYYVSDVARLRKEVCSDHENRYSPRLFTFFRIRSADGEADFATYSVNPYHHSGDVNLDGCDHAERICYFRHPPGYVIYLDSGLFTRFPIVRRDRNEHTEDSGAVALLLGKDMPEVAAFIGGESDGIPRSLALRALVREVHRQYPEGQRQALDLYGRVRASQSGVVIEDVGANFGLAGTDATYVVRLTDAPDCSETDNPDVRQCVLQVETRLVAYNRASGSRQTRFAQIANVAAGGDQQGSIEALFVRDDSGWRMVVTDEIARFLSGVDRRNDWVVRTRDGRTLRGAPAVACVANPANC